MDEVTSSEPAQTTGAEAPVTQTEQTPQTAPAQTETQSRPEVTTIKDGETLFGKVGETKPAEEKTEGEGFYNGKYKSRDDFEKAHKELERKFHEKHQIPEKYDVEAVFAEAGITPKDRNDPEAAKEYEAFETALKEQGFTQKQTAWMTKFGGDWIRQQMLKFGPQVDRNAELAAIRAEWGDRAEDTAKEVQQWAGANLSPAVLNKPLVATAEGWKFLQRLMKEQRGPTPIRSTENARPSTDLDKELESLMKSDAYRNSLHPHHAETQQRVRGYIKTLHDRKAQG